ncbi:MAG: tetratricopeptide repeat protein [Syntrophales bacterium]|nr:tetratricopeptide repeat protein [Syntrophales bacterium]
MNTGRYKTALFFIIISVTIICIYWQVQEFKFVYYDDNAYVTEKPYVLAGLTWKGVKWAFTATEAGFWHPITWLSLMLDSELFRLHTGAYHWTNVIFHLISSLLFFFFLRIASGREILSFLSALLFAVHPLHVESVAWVSQRKDVLSTLFGFASLLAYVYYARTPVWWRYVLVLFLFILALMAKPMVVTFPLIMLILDFWPLGRNLTISIKRLIGEKLPLFFFSLVASGLVIYTEKKIGALTSIQDLGLGIRLANTLVSYVKYMLLTIYPTNLAFFYPYPDRIPVWQWLGALVLLVGLTALVFLRAKRYPYLAAGWLWYVITLLPVSGIIQVGAHAMADRYSYIPINGLFIMAAWGTAEMATTHIRKIIISTAWILAIILLSYAAWVQTGYWKNTETLMKRALQVTEKNWIAYTNLGVFYSAEGKPEEGLRHIEQAIKLKPQYSIIHYNMGYTLNLLKRHAEALPYLENALKMGFKLEDTLLQIGHAHEKLGNWDEAIASYRKIIEKKPSSLAGFRALAYALEAVGKTEEAQKEWKKIIISFPGDVLALKRLMYLRLINKDYEEVIRIGEEAIQKKVMDAELYRLLSLAHRAKGNKEKANQYLKLSESIAQP